MQEKQSFDIKAIIGLGNPGHKFELNRHNIGFLILNALGDRYNASWQVKPNMELSEIEINSKNILLIKPQTFMNDSGKVIGFLQKKGIKPENILVVHDELEFPFAKLQVRFGGSARGHNGLKSIIEHCGPEFIRLRFGTDRPADRAMVSNYVLGNFTQSSQDLEAAIYKAVNIIEDLFK
ncbi:MAG: peptidyl-tRNA hydrolase [candidate division TM6 bacterium GW2011_GWF2_30_66]|jgi:PTH1 family peptidyl-tRNA hydrolase|nr:MAG: peptidyl-tRNA hydrolase [candidate division TM6 bacterium GW2011_GWF2_30_66]